MSDRTKPTLRTMLASGTGGAIGSGFGLLINPSSWIVICIAGLIGFVVGYLLYDIKTVVQSVSQAKAAAVAKIEEIQRSRHEPRKTPKRVDREIVAGAAWTIAFLGVPIILALSSATIHSNAGDHWLVLFPLTNILSLFAIMIFGGAILALIVGTVTQVLNTKPSDGKTRYIDSFNTWIVMFDYFRSAFGISVTGWIGLFLLIPTPLMCIIVYPSLLIYKLFRLINSDFRVAAGAGAVIGTLFGISFNAVWIGFVTGMITGLIFSIIVDRLPDFSFPKFTRFVHPSIIKLLDVRLNDLANKWFYPVPQYDYPKPCEALE